MIDHGSVRAFLQPASLLSFACLACVACVHGAGSTRVMHPGAGAVPTNMVSIANEWGDEELLGLPPGSLTSDATLVSIAPGRSCFDLALRVFRGASHDHMAVSLVVDGTETDKPVTLHECKGDTPCTPSDWRLPEGVGDEDKRVRRMAGRACFDIPMPREQVTAIARMGSVQMRFRWQFDSQPPTP